MKLFTSKWLTLIVVAAFSSATMFSGCTKDETKDDDEVGTAPTVPPLSTFQMNIVDTDTNTAKMSNIEGYGKTNTYANILHAGGNLLVWNVVIALNMAVPVAAFAESFNHQAVYQSKSTWKWTYSVTVIDSYTAELYGKLVGDKVEWEMYLSRTTGAKQFSQFKWFTGENNLAITEGSWKLYRDTNQPLAIDIDIDWERNLTDSTSSIKYTNATTTNAGYGDYITYGVVDDAMYDAFYDIYVNDNLTKIKWNLETGDGSVQDAKRFSDPNWHCWDSTFVDIANCPF